jgi:hypothetical protein
MSEIELIKKYKFFHLEFSDLDEAAKFFDVSKQMMSAVFSAHKKPTSKMLDKAGIKKITETKYEQVNNFKEGE